MKTSAIVRDVHVSPRKANLVCTLIRGKKVNEALTILEHCDKKTAVYLTKLLTSAIANATNNHSMNGDKLFVYSCVANQGRMIKRAMPRAKGSSNMIRKRHSHLLIVLSDNPKQKEMDLKAIKAKIQKKNKKPVAAKAATVKKPVATKPTTKPTTKPQNKKETK